MSSDKCGIFNPLFEDFIVYYDSNGKSPRKFVLPAQDISWWEEWEAKHIKKHLITKIQDVRGIKDNQELDAQRLLEEIEVRL